MRRQPAPDPAESVQLGTKGYSPGDSDQPG